MSWRNLLLKAKGVTNTPTPELTKLTQGAFVSSVSAHASVQRKEFRDLPERRKQQPKVVDWHAESPRPELTKPTNEDVGGWLPRSINDQFDRDRLLFEECSRIFGAAFPPPSDPMSPLVDQPPTPSGQATVIQKFREDENRLRHMVETGELSTDPMPMPHPLRAGAYRRERDVYLTQEKRRAAQILANRGEKLLRLPLGYEGPGNSRVRRFMTRQGFVVSVPRHVIDGVDSVRVAILATDDGEATVAAYEAAFVAPATRKTEFPSVHRKPGRIEIDIRSGYRPTIGPWVRRLVADLQRQGLGFDVDLDKLVMTFKGEELDDRTLGLALPNADVIGWWWRGFDG